MSKELDRIRSEIKELVEDYKIEPLVPSYKPFWTATMSKARIPDEAVEAAARALASVDGWVGDESCCAEAAIEAALPILRAEWEREVKARLSEIHMTDYQHNPDSHVYAVYNGALRSAAEAITGPEQEQGE